VFCHATRLITAALDICCSKEISNRLRLRHLSDPLLTVRAARVATFPSVGVSWGGYYYTVRNLEGTATALLVGLLHYLY
jgi:hypothetical protein